MNDGCDVAQREVSDASVERIYVDVAQITEPYVSFHPIDIHFVFWKERITK